MATSLSFTIDPTTGLLGTDDGSAGSTNHGRSFGADPLGRFVVAGQGQFSGLLQVTAADGTEGNLILGSGIFPQEIFVGPGQHFVYATIFAAPNSIVHVYIVDPDTWTLTEAPSSPLPGFTSIGNLVADPTGLFVYQSTAPNQVRVYSVDPSTGYLSEVTNSPFTAPGFGLPVAFSVDTGGIQPVSGPVATLTPPTLSLGSAQVGTPSSAQTVMLSSTGDQALSVNAIAVAGANAAEFAESDTCGAPTALAPTHSCFISIVFTPAAAGSRTANLSITDNASGSPQSVPLSGIGVATPPPAPAITFVPGMLNFPSLSQNATSSPLSHRAQRQLRSQRNVHSAHRRGASSHSLLHRQRCRQPPLRHPERHRHRVAHKRPRAQIHPHRRHLPRHHSRTTCNSLPARTSTAPSALPAPEPRSTPPAWRHRP